MRVIDSLWEKDGGQNTIGKWFDLLCEGAGQHSIAVLLDSLRNPRGSLIFHG